MPNRCVICGRGQRTGASTISFPDDDHIKAKWMKFINRSEFKYSKTSRLCEDHFEESSIVRHAKKILLTSKDILPTIRLENGSVTPPSAVIPTIIPPRKPPTERVYQVDELAQWKNMDIIKGFTELTAAKCQNEFTFKHLGDAVVYFNMVFEDGVPTIKEAIKITESMQVSLSFEGVPIPLPDMIRSNKFARIRHFSELENLPSYIRNRASEFLPSDIMKEIMSVSHFKPKGRPPYSAKTMRFSLLMRYTSRQAYSLLLNQMPFPSFSLLEKLHSGRINAMKAAKFLLDNGKMSRDIVMMFDEIYLQKEANYQGGDFIGADVDGRLYKGVVCFMIVGLKESVPIVIKAIPEVTIAGEWLKDEIIKSIEDLHALGFRVRAPSIW